MVHAAAHRPQIQSSTASPVAVVDPVASSLCSWLHLDPSHASLDSLTTSAYFLPGPPTDQLQRLLDVATVTMKQHENSQALYAEAFCETRMHKKSMPTCECGLLCAETIWVTVSSR